MTEQSRLRHDVGGLVAEVLAPGRFFVGPDVSLETEHAAGEELYWELFHGRLLDATGTRRRQAFESWNIYWLEAGTRSPGPILSIKLDPSEERLYVTRGLRCYGWEAFEEGGNVIGSREVRKWVRELVAVLDLAQYPDRDVLRRHLAHRVFQAVIGTSRLPLTSVEAPLPAFTLGQLSYFPSMQPGSPLRSGSELIERGLTKDQTPLQTVKLLETVLRAVTTNELGAAAEGFARRWRELGRSPSEFPALYLAMFDEAALSPWTAFVAKSLDFLKHLQEEGWLTAALHADSLAGLLRRIGRHLTAFDLVTFHHRGANYPDALLLDAVLKALLHLLAHYPDLFRDAPKDTAEDLGKKRLRRRGLRQAWLLRLQYEGHQVPAIPTSPGENQRVLPPSFPHLPEAGIVEPGQRTRRLYTDDPLRGHRTPLVDEVLRQSITDLEHPGELQELGMALFLDRPLGVYKHPAEPDQTLLLSYEAFSPTLAERRLVQLAQDPGAVPRLVAAGRERLRAGLPVKGPRLEQCARPARPGAPSLQDAFRVAADFQLLRTTRRTVNDFLHQFDLSSVEARWPLDLLRSPARVLLVGGGAVKGQPVNALTVFDADLQPRLEFEFDPGGGYLASGIAEYPARGLQLVRVWEPAGEGGFTERDVRQEQLWVGRGSC